jgi:DNA processing protein
MQKSTDRILFWIALNSIAGVGRSTFRKLIRQLGSPEQALQASAEELRAIGLSEKTIDEIGSNRWQEHAREELARAAAAGVDIIPDDDPRYPALLRETPDHPLYLYVKGQLEQREAAVAIVGTRSPSPYGMTVTHRIAGELAAAGLTVVSGLARGIDTQAHKGALTARGRTIAVLACGIDMVYPPENKALAAQIVKSGALVTENPFGTKPESGYFPARNRIISGLARGTVIIEAAEDSGSLITAKYTNDQNRKLYAVPGNVGSPFSRGPNNLIKQGALLVENADDVLKDLGIRRQEPGQARGPVALPAFSTEEAKIFGCLGNEPKHIDAIMNESRIEAGRLSAALMSLELMGVARQLPGKYFVREE